VSPMSPEWTVTLVSGRAAPRPVFHQGQPRLRLGCSVGESSPRSHPFNNLPKSVFVQFRLLRHRVRTGVYESHKSRSDKGLLKRVAALTFNCPWASSENCLPPAALVLLAKRNRRGVSGGFVRMTGAYAAVAGPYRPAHSP